jgi:hemolysin III
LNAHKIREPVNGLTHLSAAVMAAIGVVVLLYLTYGALPEQLAILIYGSSLILMFSASAAYHLVRANPRATLWLRKLDHSSIYLLIAGTYTPICIHFFAGFWRWGILAIVWSMALVGIAVKLLIIHAPRWLTAGIYLVMGWMAVFAAREILTAMPVGALAWLLAGGVLFSLGALVYILKRPDLWPGKFGFHEVWHIFVILGCLAHFILVAAYVASPG